MRRPQKTGDENVTLLACDRMQCFAKKVLAHIATYMFISYTKKDVDLFWKGLVLELYS